MIDSPIIMKFKGHFGFQHVKQCITSYLQQYLSNDDFDFMEIAVYEAINNAINHSHLSDTGWITVKTNFTRGAKRSRLTIRIKDQGRGFPVEQTLESLSASLDFTNTETNESGRGMLIMMAATDFIVYNACGNEVLLVKYVYPEGQKAGCIPGEGESL